MGSIYKPINFTTRSNCYVGNGFFNFDAITVIMARAFLGVFRFYAALILSSIVSVNVAK